MGTFPIKSMTGFGHAERETSRGRFTVELRTVNNRYQDISISLSRELGVLELPMRQLLKQEIPRGKVDCRVRFTPAGEQQPRVNLNVDLARQYIERFRELAAAGATGELPLNVLAGLPGVVEIVPAEYDEQVMWRYLRGVTEQAIEGLNRERSREGGALAEQLQELAAKLRAHKMEIDRTKDQVLVKYRERLRARLEQLQAETSSTLEPGRLEIEVALFADRSDVTEELTRIDAHLERFEALLRSDEDSVGRGLEFLLQEFQREINTIGSKARETDVINHTLEMKNIVERIREQVQNIQ